MRTYVVSFALVLPMQFSFGQVQFISKLESFSVTVPVNPTEKTDTIETKFGKLPRYTMMAQTVDHGANLLYIIQVVDLAGSESAIDLGQLKADLINNKAASNLGSRLVKEEQLKEPGVPYELELVFADQHGVTIDFVRLFCKGTKYFAIETFQTIGAIKFGYKPNKLTREYFQSFRLTN